ncbi:MAG: HDOD domain-containing protein, partial [Planctomycetota bacterium]
VRSPRAERKKTMESSSFDLAADLGVLRMRFGRLIRENKLKLPVFSGTAAEILELCNSDACDARELADLVQGDVSIAGHVLRVANSAAYAPEEPIVSLQQAVSRLGMSTLCEIALGIAVRAEVFAVEGFEKRLDELWRHSAATGAWSKEIARLRRKNVEGAYLGGLLHDVGMPVCLQAGIDLCAEEKIDVTEELVESLMDELHGEVGGTMLERWKMPEWMSSVCRHHHYPDNATSWREEVAAVGLADRLAHWSLDEESSEEEIIRSLPALETLGLYSDELDTLFERASHVAQQAEAVS